MKREELEIYKGKRVVLFFGNSYLLKGVLEDVQSNSLAMMFDVQGPIRIPVDLDSISDVMDISTVATNNS